MNIPQEINNYIRETIDDSLGLPVSTRTLQLKLRASEDAQRGLHDQYSLLLEKLRQKDQLVNRAKAEANMNAMALKKFVEENQRLAADCANLVNQCNKWERECSLYHNDREALMDFGNEADERAKQAELRVHQLEVELGKLSEELLFYKTRETDSSLEITNIEENLLVSILETYVGKDGVGDGHAFPVTNCVSDSCQKLLKMWNSGSLRPLIQKVLSLVAKVRTLQDDKEHLRINLTKAEDEVKLLFEANNILDEENKRLLRQHHRDRNFDGHCGKHTHSACAKSNKRKLSLKMSSPVERKIDSTDIDLLRQPLSPLGDNSPECRMLEK